MGWRVRAAVIAATLAATSGCLASDEDEALRLARSACEWYREAPAPTDSAKATDINAMASAMDPSVEQVALAAQKDPRWDRMSNAWTDLQTAIRKNATATGNGSGAQAAREEIQRLNVPELTRTISQECRKAEAR